MTLPQTLIRFPEIHLEKRDAHKLRGYFGNLFKEHSPLLHNHFEDGSLRYKYPLVQYKVIKEVPLLVGLNEGAKLLTDLFLKIQELRINGHVYPLFQKNLDHFNIETGLSLSMHTYRFENLWMALNQENHKRYRQLSDQLEKQDLLNSILRNNLLSFFKGVGIWLEGPLTATGVFSEHSTQFKDQPMLAFYGEFSVNATLPDLVGIGKAVSRGFGSILPAEAIIRS
jgi:hypothetical protein